MYIYNNNNNSYIYFCYYVTEGTEPNKIKPRECNTILLRLDTTRYTLILCPESTTANKKNATNNATISSQGITPSAGGLNANNN